MANANELKNQFEIFASELVIAASFIRGGDS